MALYNKFHAEYDNEANGGKEDYYHGEYDDEAYGNLYIPHMEEDVADFETLKNVIKKNKLGTVTSAIFNALTVPAAYKGKNTKQLYSAFVYVKWFANSVADNFRKHMMSGNKKKSRVIVNKEKDTYWIIRPNTAFPSHELLEERLQIEELAEEATDVASRCLDEDEEEELVLCDLEETARDVARRCLDEQAEEELALWDLARAIALKVV